MHEKFFDSLVNTDDFYDPFESPPSIRKAQIHRRAVSVGKDKD